MDDAARRQLVDAFPDAGLGSTALWVFLRAVDAHPEPLKLSAREMGRIRDLHPATACGVVATLVRRGILTRSPEGLTLETDPRNWSGRFGKLNSKAPGDSRRKVPAPGLSGGISPGAQLSKESFLAGIDDDHPRSPGAQLSEDGTSPGAQLSEEQLSPGAQLSESRARESPLTSKTSSELNSSFLDLNLNNPTPLTPPPTAEGLMAVNGSDDQSRPGGLGSRPDPVELRALVDWVDERSLFAGRSFGRAVIGLSETYTVAEMRQAIETASTWNPLPGNFNRIYGLLRSRAGEWRVEAEANSRTPQNGPGVPQDRSAAPRTAIRTFQADQRRQERTRTIYAVMDELRRRYESSAPGPDQPGPGDPGVDL